MHLNLFKTFHFLISIFSIQHICHLTNKKSKLTSNKFKKNDPPKKKKNQPTKKKPNILLLLLYQLHYNSWPWLSYIQGAFRNRNDEMTDDYHFLSLGTS